MPDVRCDGVSITFGTVVAMRDFSTCFPSGKISVVVGPSGSGKSTLLKAIAGLARPSAGRIVVGERLMFDAATRHNVAPEDRELGFVFQAHALWPHMNVAANVAFPLKLRRRPAAEIRSRVAETLELVGLSSRATHLPGQLSGGEAQRVSLARAIVYDPKVLLLDEPLSSIDAQLRAGLRDQIRHIQTSLGTTMVYVTHDRTEAAYLGDELFVVRAGGLVESGPSEAITTTPRHPFTAEFLLDAAPHRGRYAGGRLVLEGATAPIELAGPPAADSDLRLFAIPPAAVELTTDPAARALVRRRTVFGGTYHYVVAFGGMEWPVLDPSNHSVGSEVGFRLRRDRLFEYPLDAA